MVDQRTPARRERALTRVLRTGTGVLWRGLPILVLALWELGHEVLRTGIVPRHDATWWGWVALGMLALGAISRYRRAPDAEDAPTRASVMGLMGVLLGIGAAVLLALLRTARWAWGEGELVPALLRSGWDAAVLTTILVVLATSDLVETAGARSGPKQA